MDFLLVMEDRKKIFIRIYKVLAQGKNLLLRSYFGNFIYIYNSLNNEFHKGPYRFSGGQSGGF